MMILIKFCSTYFLERTFACSMMMQRMNVHKHIVLKNTCHRILGMTAGEDFIRKDYSPRKILMTFFNSMTGGRAFSIHSALFQTYACHICLTQPLEEKSLLLLLHFMLCVIKTGSCPQIATHIIAYTPLAWCITSNSE